MTENDRQEAACDNDRHTDMADPISPSDGIRERALYWLTRIQSGEANAADRAALERWLAASPAHRQAYAALRAAWSELPLPAAELAAARRYVHRRSSPWRAWSAAVAALLVMAVGLAAFEGWPLADTGVYRTAKGERRTAILPDGSQVELNSDTVLAVRYGWSSRSVELARGEALFSIAAGKLRPFEVKAAGGLIRDIGTRFDVDLRPGSVRVAVLEGAVRIRLSGTGKERQVNEGQTAGYSAAGVLTEAAPADLSAATAWREGKLVFRAAPLSAVFAELGRYHAATFRIADPGLERLSLSGVFHNDDLPLFLATLEAVLPVKTRQTGDGSIVVERAKR
ncbi:FecR family protein [Methylocaldum sp. MU1018]